MHFLNRDLQTVGQVPEVALGGLLGGQALAEQLTLPVHLADDHEGYNEGWKEAEAEGEEKLGHGIWLFVPKIQELFRLGIQDADELLLAIEISKPLGADLSLVLGHGAAGAFLARRGDPPADLA